MSRERMIDGRRTPSTRTRRGRLDGEDKQGTACVRARGGGYAQPSQARQNIIALARMSVDALARMSVDGLA